LRPPPRPPAFPYPTLFRSRSGAAGPTARRRGGTLTGDEIGVRTLTSASGVSARNAGSASTTTTAKAVAPAAAATEGKRSRARPRSEEHTSELPSLTHLLCR